MKKRIGVFAIALLLCVTAFSGCYTEVYLPNEEGEGASQSASSSGKTSSDEKSESTTESGVESATGLTESTVESKAESKQEPVSSAAGKEPIQMTEKKIALTDGRIKYLGRSAVSEERVLWDYSCTGFEININGTGAKVEIREKPTSTNQSFYGVWVDGEKTQNVKLEKGLNTFVLAENLSEGTHHIRLVKLNETRFTRSDLEGITIVGDLAERPADKALKIEFIGDSLTAGFGNLTSNPNQDYTSATQDGTQTFAFKTAELLNADYSIVAVSGWGLAQDCDGNTKNILPAMYEYSAYFGQKLAWDFNRFQPDVVVINLGTNDFSSKVSGTLFAEKVQSFSELIAKKNPGAQIVWCYGLATNNGLETVQAAVEAVEGVENIHFVQLPLMNTQVDGVGGLWHPSIKSHNKAGEALAKAIEEILK